MRVTVCVRADFGDEEDVTFFLGLGGGQNYGAQETQPVSRQQNPQQRAARNAL